MNEKQKEREERLKLLKQFGKHLIKLRESKGLTAAELARNCFMERSNIARLEAGRTNPSLFILKKLSVGMDIKMEELLKGLE